MSLNSGTTSSNAERKVERRGDASAVLSTGAHGGAQDSLHSTRAQARCRAKGSGSHQTSLLSVETAHEYWYSSSHPSSLHMLMLSARWLQPYTTLNWAVLERGPLWLECGGLVRAGEVWRNEPRPTGHHRNAASVAPTASTATRPWTAEERDVMGKVRGKRYRDHLSVGAHVAWT